MHLELRKVRKDDLLILFKWVNSKAVRRFAFSQTPISLSDHKKWFSSKLDSSDHYMFVGSIGEELIGQVRFDRVNENLEFIVDIHLAPKFGGKGLGKKLLRKGLEKLCLAVGRPLQVTALVFDTNIASIKCFEANEFVVVATETIGLNSCKRFVWFAKDKRFSNCT